MSGAKRNRRFDFDVILRAKHFLLLFVPQTECIAATERRRYFAAALSNQFTWFLFFPGSWLGRSSRIVLGGDSTCELFGLRIECPAASLTNPTSLSPKEKATKLRF
jgi:hypothetical protein